MKEKFLTENLILQLNCLYILKGIQEYINMKCWREKIQQWLLTKLEYIHQLENNLPYLFIHILENYEEEIKVEKIETGVQNAMEDA